MVSKILKLELILFFFVTFFVCTVYYFYDVLPDNYLSISSSDKNLNFLSYYITSFLVFIEYYTGPWVLFPFFVFSGSYAFFYSRRSYKLDPLNIFFLLSGFFLIFSIYGSGFLGKGLLFIWSDYLPAYLSLFFAVLSFFIFILSSLRGLFFKFLFKVNLSRCLDPKVFKSLVMKPVRIFSITVEMPQKFYGFLRLKIFGLLKGSGETIADYASVNIESEPKIGIDDNLDLEVGNVIQPQLSGEIKNTDIIKDKMNIRKSSRNEESGYYDIVKNIKRNPVSNRNQSPDNIYFENIINRIEDKLREFNIDGHIINILKGPVVDTFELELGSGVRVSKVTSSTEDLKMALHGAPIRIVYPMRGKTTIGIEVPRNPREIIYLDELLTSKDFQNSKFLLPLAMGKDAFGQPFVVDLASMPHMLVAGSTGSGKSVFINSILVSLLVKRSPSQMKLILIDPKKLELSLYANLPHLLLPVVTEAKIASLSLAWVVQEMERRYSILKEFQVRNISGFNQKLETATPEMCSRIKTFYDHSSSQDDYKLPYIVVIVDEFADLILTKAGKEIEGNICRLAGKARAAGVHLIIATQRPSVDVITGLIKSNFPTRVSFRVSTSIDSRTILSAMGAENLLGKGDMLYKNGVDTFRVHSSYVDEDEIELLTNKISEIGPIFSQEALDFIESEDKSHDDPYAFGSHITQIKDDGDDTLLQEAIDLVVEYRAASASMLQRRMKIGYNRAANLIEKMEEKGIVGPQQGSKPRKVLASSDHQL